MKRMFESKLNIFLFTLLIIVIGVAIWFGFAMFGNPFNKTVNAIDFSQMNKSEVEAWISENGLDEDKYNFTYEYDETIEEGYVVYQSVKVGEPITNTITFIISKGQDPNNVVDVSEKVKDMNYTTAKEWFKQNGFEKVIYKFETNEEKAYGELISVSPSIAKKEDTINVTVSYGADIEDISTTVPSFKTYTKEEIENWANEFAIELSIKYETSDDAKENEFISQSLNQGTEINGGDSLIVVLSSGSKPKEETKTEENKTTETNKKTIPDSYIGLSENDFVSKLKELGFTNLSKSSVTYYAESLNKDSIYYYDDGTFETSKTINYALCAGKWSFDASDFNGLTTESANTKIKDLKNRNAKVDGTLISISFINGTTDTTNVGKTYDCSISGSKISCKVYTGGKEDKKDNNTSTVKATIPSNLLGTSESDFLAKLKSLGFNNVSKSSTSYYSTTLANGTVWSYDDGTFDTSTTINYALSVGKYSFNADDFNGLSSEEATSKVKGLNSRNANSGNLSIGFVNGETNNDKVGKVYNCNINSNTITCSVYQKVNEEPTVKTGTIMSIANIRSWYDGNTYDEIKQKVNDYLVSQGFKNLSFEAIDGDGYYVNEIYVNNQKHTTLASYDVNSSILVKINTTKN